MSPHNQPTTAASRLTRATLLLAVGGTLAFLAMPGAAVPPADPGGDAVITVDFAADDMGFNVTSTKDISNVIVVLCDDSQHKHDELDGLHFNHTEAQEVVGVYVKSGNNGIEGNDPPGAGEYFANEGVDCGETSTSTSSSTSDTDTGTSGSETDTSTSSTDTATTGSESDTETDTGEIPVFGTATTLALGIGGALGGALLMLRRRL